MAKYTDTQHTVVELTIDGVTLSIPADPANRHYREHILDAGVTPAAYAPPPDPVPATVTPRQLILGLLHDGRLTAAEAEAWTQGTLPAGIEAALAALPAAAAVDARISLRTMAEARRDDPLTTLLAAAHGLDDAAVDEGFRRWAAL